MTSPPDPAPASRQRKEPIILGLGLLRTGTSSLQVALQQLGYKTYHGLDSMDTPIDWNFWERAAEATWPDIAAPNKRPPPKPFTRTDWDEFLGAFDAATDVASLFAPQLLAAYPDAKVILTTREVNKWLPSMTSQVIRPLFKPFINWVYEGLAFLVGNRAGVACRKLMAGFFGATTLDTILAAAPRVYEEHYTRVHALVPPERLLIFQTGKDGWGPLCEFLGKDIPEGDFPRVNDTAAHNARTQAKLREAIRDAATLLAPYVLGLVSLGIALMWYK